MRPNRLSPELRALLSRHPLPRRADGDRILKGDLESGAEKYRDLGAAGSISDPWWSVFFAIESELGNAFDQSVARLDATSKLSVARWAFEQGRTDIGVSAYRGFLESGEATPDVVDARRYVDNVASSLGPAEGLRAADEVLKRLDAPEIRLCAIELALSAGDVNGARQRIAGRGASAEDWALLAIVEARLGNPAGMQRGLEGAAKRRLTSPVVERAMLDAAQLTDSAWGRLRTQATQPAAPPAPQKPLKRGAILMPTQERSPHSFGGFDLFMPPCPACGQPIRQWFLISVEDDFELKRSLRKLRELPLVGCGACRAYYFRHDYVIDAEGTELKLIQAHARPEDLAQAAAHLEPLPVVPRQNVMLMNRASLPDEAPFTTFIGGDAPWLRAPQAVHCVRCTKPMLFVAAMGQVRNLVPNVTFHGGAGYQLHFACDPCRTLTVIPELPG